MDDPFDALSQRLAAIDRRLEWQDEVLAAFGERLAAVERRAAMPQMTAAAPATTAPAATTIATGALPSSAVGGPTTVQPIPTRVAVSPRPTVAQPVPVRVQPAPTATTAGVAPAASAAPTAGGPVPGSALGGPRLPLASPRPVAPIRPQRSLADLERAISGRGLALVGGLALLLGALFFLSLAFSRGWIGPEARVVIGLVAGVGLFGLGTWSIGKRDPLLGRVLVAVGIGVWNLGLVAATRLYGLVPAPLGLAGALLGAAAAAVVAIRADAPVVAAYGLVTGLLAPILLGADTGAATVGYLGALLLGSTAIALGRGWRWLPWIAFGLTAPQLGWWLDDRPSIPLALTAVAALWLLTALGAGGDGLRRRSARAGMPAVTLLVADAAGALGFGFQILGERPGYAFAGFVFALALAHAALAWVAFERGGRDRQQPFAVAAAGVGLATLAFAIALRFDGGAVAVLWAAQAAALVWVAARRRSLPAAVAALAAGLLAVGHLFSIEYPLDDLADAAGRPDPFVNGDALTLALVLAAAAAAGWFSRSRSVRRVVAAGGVLAAAAALPFEVAGLPLLTGFAFLTVAVLAAPRWPVLTPDGRPLTVAGARLGDAGIDILLATAGVLAIAGWIAFDRVLPIGALDWRADGAPFASVGAAAAAIVAVAAVAGALATRNAAARSVALAAAVAVVAYLLPFELGAAATVAGWALLATIGVALLLTQRSPLPLGFVSAAIGVGAALLATQSVAPPTDAFASADGAAGTFDPGLLLAFGPLAAALAVCGRLLGDRRGGRWLAAGSLLAVGWLVPFVVGPGAAVVAWGAVGLAAVRRDRRSGVPGEAGFAAGGLLFAAAGVAAFVLVAPPDRLAVDAGTDPASLPRLATVVAFAGLAVAVGLLGRSLPAGPPSGWCRAVAGVLAVYGLSVVVVDAFQARTGAATLAEVGVLAKQAQVALSVTWALVGGGLVAAGLTRFGATARLGGLALLALATLKVFVIDLASLDATYRVLSFIGLGALLLASSWAYRHLNPPDDPADPVDPAQPSGPAGPATP